MLRFKICLIFFAYQCFALKEADVSNEVNTTLATYWCDDHLMQDIERHLKVVNFAQENQRLSIELLSKKIDELQNLLQKVLENQTKTDIITQTTNPKPISQQLPPTQISSCDQALSESSNENGVYQLHLPNQPEPFFAYCMKDSSTGEAWMIIQRRMNGKVDFHRKWLDYKVGFGDLYGEYWLGLDLIHALTNSRPHKLWIELGDFENLTHHANYSLFAIGNEETKFALNVLGDFSGDAGDSLRYHVGQKFSTKDNTNDASDHHNCAIERKGAWWFNSCQECNLNGEYLKGTLKNSEYGMGINWYSWHGSYYSMKYTHMAIRPVN